MGADGTNDGTAPAISVEMRYEVTGGGLSVLKTIGTRSWSGAVTDCTSGTLQAHNDAGLDLKTGWGQGTTVHLALRYLPGSALDTIASYCVKNFKVTYDIVTKVRRGGV